MPLLGILLAGCASSGSDEAKAAAELAPKPPSAEQKAQIDKIKNQFPAAAAPGHP